jgi:hypothetical protein
MPSEIRLTIFQLPGMLPLDEEMPDLIIALRPDYRLYDEALTIFYSRKTCYMNNGNLIESDHIDLEALHRIKMLHFILGGPQVANHVILINKSSVQEFELVFIIGAGGDQQAYFVTILNYIGSMAENSEALQKKVLYGADWHGSFRDLLVQMLNLRLQVEGRYVGGPMLWETKAGKFDWKA